MVARPKGMHAHRGWLPQNEKIRRKTKETIQHNHPPC